MRLTSIGTALFSLTMAVSQPAAQFGPVVDVTGGRVRGEHMADGGAVFKGIPYAAPPLGELRWREPMPVLPWADVREATAFGAICPQNLSAPLRNPQALMSELRMNEDCLSLNIWTPEWPMRDARPVLVWLPGGGNIFGAAMERRHDGQYLARRGIVVVTLSYRLGSFGFFSHPALTAESPRQASGNQGLLDQIAALRWVRANIARFGGNPAAVTLGGNSAGGVDTTALMTSPLADGLFTRAIVQSGPARSVLGEPLTRVEAERRGATHTATWGAAPDASLAELRSIPIETILKAQPARPVAHLNLSVDGDVLPSAPASVFASGRQQGVPSIMGSAVRDFTPGAEPPSDLPALLADTYGPLAERARALYATGDSIYGTPAVQLATDLGFRCGTVLQWQEHTRAGHSAYAYEFVRLATPPLQPGGNMHGFDGLFSFGTLVTRAKADGAPPVEVTSADLMLADLMQQYWVNFVKTGNPNAPRLPSWPAFRESERAYVELAPDAVIVKQGLRRAQCDLYIENANRVAASTRRR